MEEESQGQGWPSQEIMAAAAETTCRHVMMCLCGVNPHQAGKSNFISLVVLEAFFVEQVRYLPCIVCISSLLHSLILHFRIVAAKIKHRPPSYLAPPLMPPRPRGPALMPAGCASRHEGAPPTTRPPPQEDAETPSTPRAPQVLAWVPPAGARRREWAPPGESRGLAHAMPANSPSAG